MIDFIILEDNPYHSKLTHDIIMNYMMKNKYDFDIKIFDKENDELLNTIEDNVSNRIYILDFELPNTTAIDVARKIRDKDWISPIIVFTVNGGMALETFKQRLQILDFVNKQFEAEKNLHELFDICLKQLEVRNSFKYKAGTKNINIDFNKILYIYRDKVERKSVIVTDTKEIKVPLSLKNVKSLLNTNFKYTHKTCIVNNKRVIALLWKDSKIIFDNGMEAPFLSKTHKKELELSEIV